jgi:nitrogen fixation NifU-like protein
MLYSKEVIKHFRHPQNVGKMKNPDGVGKAGNIRCGDIMHLYIKVGKNKKGEEIIEKSSFLTYGCAIAIANTSLLTTMIKGMTLKEAMKLTKDDPIEKFGEVPIIKIHCSLLAVDALIAAIYNYLSKNKKPIPKELKERYERIARTEKEIEKRHQELVKIEKQLYKSEKPKK